MARMAAIFDVDRTLLDGMSGSIFTGHLWKSGLLPLSNRLRVIGVVSGYRIGLLAEERLVEIGVTCYSGLRVQMLEEAAEDCVRRILRPRVFKEALDAIRGHRQRGDLVLLASGSSDILIRALAKFAGADGCVATSALVEKGVSTARAREPLCYKQGKLDLIEGLLDRHGIPLAGCHIYSDNDADLSIFHKVTHRHAVNPCVILFGEAQKRGWEILSWRTPLDPSYTVTGTSWPVKENAKR